jgi:nucleoid DNA-binding protein
MKQETGMNAFFENVCCSLTSGRKIHIRKAFYFDAQKRKANIGRVCTRK